MEEKTRYQRYDWDEVFKDFESSGLSRSAYCKRENINLSTFRLAWRRAGKYKETISRKPSFIKAEVESILSGVIVEFPNGVKVSNFPFDRIEDLACLSLTRKTP